MEGRGDGRGELLICGIPGSQLLLAFYCYKYRYNLNIIRALIVLCFIFSRFASPSL
jgi:hypothetical protein